MRVLYDFDLMQSGGHITGRLLEGEILDEAEKMIAEYEAARRGADVGNGQVQP